MGIADPRGGPARRERRLALEPAARRGSGQDLRRRGQAIPTHDLLLLQSPLGSTGASSSPSISEAARRRRGAARRRRGAAKIRSRSLRFGTLSDLEAANRYRTHVVAVTGNVNEAARLRLHRNTVTRSLDLPGGAAGGHAGPAERGMHHPWCIALSKSWPNRGRCTLQGARAPPMVHRGARRAHSPRCFSGREPLPQPFETTQPMALLPREAHCRRAAREGGTAFALPLHERGGRRREPTKGSTTMSQPIKPRPAFGVARNNVPGVLARATIMQVAIVAALAMFAAPPITMAAFLLLIQAAAAAQSAAAGRGKGLASLRDTKVDAVGRPCSP